LNEWKNTLDFSTYDELSDSFIKTMEPLLPFYQGRKGHLKVGSHGTVYKEDARQVEAFLRVLWGLGPFLTQQEAPDLLSIYLEGIVAGTDPQNKDYWGEVTDYDQLLVEMASLATTFMLVKEKTWDSLSDNERENFVNWLDQINHHTMPSNNWHFFRILVNICLKKMGVTYSQELLDEDLALMDSYYVGKGWYYDGEETQLDYYIPWAFHYYGLVYATVMADEDPERSCLFKQRAAEFAQSFVYMFDADGAAVPFGRSLSYRFAQNSFWSALVFADVEALPWGVIKGIYARNMRFWYSNEIFTTDGILNVGYAYQNLVMAEGYNSPGSPYWAFKSFLLLAVPKSHPYWQSPELPLNFLETKYVNPEGRALYTHSNQSNHVQMYPYGQSVINQNHSASKYSKFVYSTKFGFSVPKSDYHYYEGAFDNVLAVSEDETHFRAKAVDTLFEVNDEWVSYEWAPYKDVKILSTIVPCGDYHVRIQQINTDRELIAYEGGFSNRYETEERIENKTFASYVSSIGTSEITAVKGFDTALVVRPEPNTNLLFERTLLPVLRAELGRGSHLLVSIVGGVLPTSNEMRPEVQVTKHKVIITTAEKEVMVNIT